MSNFWDNDPVAKPVVAAAPKGGNFWDNDPVAERASPPVSDRERAIDVLKSGGIGLAKGGIGLVGAGGDARNLASSATDYIGRKLGIEPESVQHFKDKAFDAAQLTPMTMALSHAPSSSDIQKGIEGVTGDFYKPKTTAGEYAQTIGEFAPAAIDPEAYVGRLPSILEAGKGLLTKVLAPATASETAGQATKGTAAEPYARAAAAVVGGGLADTLNRAKSIAAPTVDELKTAARAGYNHPDVAAVRIAPAATEHLADTIASDLQFGPNSGFRPTNPAHAPVFDEVNNLRSNTPQGAVGGPMPKTVADLDNVRQALGNLAKEKDAVGQMTPAAAAASRAIDRIDDFLPKLKQGDLLAGDAANANQILETARGNWGAAKRAEEVQTKLENGRIQAASTYGGGNINNATRQALRPLQKDNFRRAGGYNADEKEALARAVEGNWVGNTARQIGKLGPDTGLKGIHHIGAAVATGGASIPLSLATLAAKVGGDVSTRRAVNNLETQLRERSPLHRSNTAAAAPVVAGQSGGQRALVRALIASQPYRGANLGPIQPAFQIPQGVPAQNQ